MFEVPAGAKGWLIVFHPRSTWWVEKLCPGRWKHVSAVGFVPEANAWVALSWNLAQMRVCIVPDDKFEAWLPEWCGGGVGVLRVAAPAFDPVKWRPRVGFCCGMIAHLLGLKRGALWPSGLWRLLIANGAEVAIDGSTVFPENPAAEDHGGREERGGERRRRAA